MSRESKGLILVLFGSVPLYGHERANIDDMEAMRERGWDALFVTHPEWGHLHIQPELDLRGFRWTTATFADRFDRGIGVRGWFRRIRDIGRGSRDLLRILRVSSPSHIHVGNLTWFIDFLPALLWTRVPIIYRLGDTPRHHRLAFRLLWRFAVGPMVAHFICISRFVRSRLLELASVEGKTSLIYNRPPRRLGALPAGTEGKSSRGLTFGYVGQITEEKGVGLLVDAACRLCRQSPDVRFLLAGGLDSDAEFASGQQSQVRASGLEKQIRFLGYVHDTGSIFGEMDVHLCPSICEEALGMTVLEAKDRGVPSIVFASGGLPEIVEDEVDGIVCGDKSAGAIEAACRRYLDRPELAAEHGRAARASLERLGVNDFGERLEEVYESHRKS